MLFKDTDSFALRVFSYTMRLSLKTADSILQQLPTNQWYTLETLNDFVLSDRLMGWLSHVGSMTRLIKTQTEDFKLEVLSAGEQSANPVELGLLGLEPTTPTYIREVRMSAAEEAWLLGRSIFPLDLVQNDSHAVQSLGETPLGRLLFGQEGQPRLSIEVALLDNSAPLLQQLKITESLYARRSIFSYHTGRVLVQEVFLPQHPIYRL